MKRYTPYLSVPLLLSLLLAGCDQAETPKQMGGGPVAVTAITLKARPVTLTRQLPGRTHAYVIAEVRPQVTGIVKERLFTEGSLVTAGQALYQLDDATYRAEWNSAKAALARAKAAADVALLNANRARELIESNTISRQDFDNAVATQRESEAEVNVAEARLASTEVKLGYARITSPIDGRIGKSTVTRGALVTADQAEPLTTVQQLDPIYVDLTRSASELLQLRRSLSSGEVKSVEHIPVAIFLDDGSRYEYEGELTFTDVAVDPSTGSYSLRVVVPNPDHLLMPGMYVRALLSNAILQRGLLVPQQGVLRDAKGNASVMVVNGDDQVELREIQVSRTIGDQWLVDAGLEEGERVIVAGLQKVRPGVTVSVTEADIDVEKEAGAGVFSLDPESTGDKTDSPWD
jgi:membrane fusion protein (multidrug efflux system)